MDTRVKQFIDLNKENILSVYNFICSSGITVSYLFLKNADCIRPELLTDARDCVVSYPYVQMLGMEEAMRECVGKYVKI